MPVEIPDYCKEYEQMDFPRNPISFVWEISEKFKKQNINNRVCYTPAANHSGMKTTLEIIGPYDNRTQIFSVATQGYNCYPCDIYCFWKTNKYANSCQDENELAHELTELLKERAMFTFFNNLSWEIKQFKENN